MLRGEKLLVLVPGATHLFEEPGALEEVARLAADWFARHLAGPRRHRDAVAPRAREAVDDHGCATVTPTRT